MATIIVIAKEPRPGRSKTRLCPPLTLDEAARVAQAMLDDTLEAVAAIPNVRRVLALDGRISRPPGWDVIPQRGGGLDERIASAFAGLSGPALLVGMDTPQLSPRLAEETLNRLADPRIDVVLGPAEDGGFWAVGLQCPEAYSLGHLFHGVPMSTSHTFAAELSRLRSLGLRVATLRMLRDVDVFADAVAVAEEAPGSRFAREIAALMSARELEAAA